MRSVYWIRFMRVLFPTIFTLQRMSPFYQNLISMHSRNLGTSNLLIFTLNNDFFGRLLDEYPSLTVLRKIHSQIIVHGFRLDPSLGIKLMRAYSFQREPIMSRYIFDEVPSKNVVFYNVMIRSYVNNQLYHESIPVFVKMMRSGVKPDNYTFPCLLKACSSSDNSFLGFQIHGAVMRVGLDGNIFVGNALTTLYGRCNCLLEAHKVFDEMSHTDIVSWNSLVAAYAQNNEFDKALDVCKEMKEKKVKPDAGTMASLLPAVTNTEYSNVIFVQNMFDKMPNRNLICWNVMIATYVNNSIADKAVELFWQMEDEGIQPDSITFASVLPACGELSALGLGKKIHDTIVKKNLFPNLFLENSLVDMYAKCGCLLAAREVFDKMRNRDVVSWTSMISAYGIHGYGLDAVTLFSQMQESGLKPDSIAFVSILSACSHGGLLNQGRYYFKYMTDKCHIKPRLEHYTCMVDLLGRAGLVDEAYDFIQQMPIDPNERVWGALLSACRVYSNMDVGLIAADHLFRLVPEQAGYYVLLSNIYAKAAKWDDVLKVRTVMKGKGIRKTPGYSNVELNNEIHTFLVGDRSHPQSKQIYEKLEFLVGKLKEVGYIAETESALHDIEEEEKEFHLSVHSEKLAIAFALINTEPKTPIRITKNLRVCSDCHVAAKFISKICEREIILRDIHRFHHIQNGICSCGDYW